MSQFYTIQYSKQLDGQDQYGNVTSSVRFEGETESVLYRHQPKTTLVEGQQLYGHIEEKTSQQGKTYYKFNREAIPEGVDTPRTGVSKAREGDTPSFKGSGNAGQKQGMCINNAAAYVANNFPEMDPVIYAKEVEAYARELYKIDLDAQPKSREEEIMEMMED